VAARRTAGEDDPARVAVMAARIAADPGDRPAALVDDPVEGDSRRKRIVDRHDSHAACRQARRHETGVVFGQQTPITAVQVDKYRPRRSAGAREYVQGLVLVISVGDAGRAGQGKPCARAALCVGAQEWFDIRYGGARIVGAIKRCVVQATVKGGSV
jgi:hypothetical protein